jgi:divalent metal cation (Fe/Co/Zn/Cd) transporter
MTFGAAIFLIAAGAIIRYALHLKIGGVNEHTLGLILIIAGVIGVAVAVFQQVASTAAARGNSSRRDDR